MDRRLPRWQAVLLLVVPLVLAAGLVVRSVPRRGAAPRAARERVVGAFRVSYGKTDSDEMARWRDELRRDQVLERAAARLNAFVRLPSDVLLRFEECGDDDAYYEKGRVTFCYEEVADYADLLARTTEAADRRRAEDAASFFIFHEAGHALVDVLRLPVTGKEEDAVDQFAIYFLSEGPPPDVRADALGAAEVLGELARAEETRPADLPVWDVHSLDGQRKANLLCWVYGGDPLAFRQAVRHAGLPDEREQSCRDEYMQLAESWEALLAPYLRTGPAGPPAPDAAERGYRASGRIRGPARALSAAPGPALSAAPGPALSAAPGPTLSAAPGPTLSAAPGPALSAAPVAARVRLPSRR